ncbi:MAG: branched-chain-amino-acid transaminase [Bacteroidota bacterium]
MNYFDDQSIVCLDGAFLTAREAMTDYYGQTMHYGNGVFEGIRAYQTDMGPRVFKPITHFQRLIDSAATMGMELSFSIQQMIDWSYELLEHNDLDNAYIRPMVFLEPNMKLTTNSKAHLFIGVWKWNTYHGDQLTRTMMSSYRRPDPRSVHIEAKVTGHYVNSILATNEAQRNGYDDAILMDVEGRIAEGAAANLFMEKNGKLYTPPLGHILPGITRDVIIHLAKEEEIEINEVYFSEDELKQADSAFFTGTASEVSGLSCVDSYTFPLEWEKSLGHELQRIYRNVVTKRRHTSFALK